MKSRSHKQERAVTTRRALIDAARTIFARHGYESASIEDIAAEAKKTRGAFYANFSDKEDVFFAIFEEDLMRSEQKIEAVLAGVTDPQERMDRLADYLAELLEDRQRILLNLEFKMYVIRHPRKRKRLNQLYTEMCIRCAMSRTNCLIQELTEKSDQERRRVTFEIGAAMDGLALNGLFSPESIPTSRRRRYLRLVTREAMRTLGTDQ